MWASSADISDSWSKSMFSSPKGCFQESLQATTSAYSEDMCDLWCKKAFFKNTQNRHVGLKCGHVRFMVQKGVFEKHSKSSCGPLVRIWAIHGVKWCSKNHLFWPCGPLVRTCSIYGPKCCSQESPILTCGPLVRTCAIYGAKRRFRKTLKIFMWASSADMSNSWSKMVLQESPILTMWASSAYMCDLWCKEAFSKNTQNRHVGL